jgi:hypothetical protein
MVSAAFDTGCNGFTKPIQYKKRQRTSMEQQRPASMTRAVPESNNNQHHSPLEGRMRHTPAADKRLDGPKNLPPLAMQRRSDGKGTRVNRRCRRSSCARSASPFFTFYRGAKGQLCNFSCINATVRSYVLLSLILCPLF